MAKKYIDLTLDVISKESWIQFPRKLIRGASEPPTIIETASTVEEHGVFVQKISTTTQCFTHIDAPAHFVIGGKTIDQIPLEQLIGEAVVIDMMHKQPGEGVTAEDLENSGVEVKEGDMVIIRTGWTDKCFGTREFWEKMIYLSEDAGEWLAGKKIKALIQDFMTDTAPLTTCEHCNSLLPVKDKWCPTHHKLLGQGVILIEWCTNLGAITKPRVTIVALPMKIKGGDGAQARVVAIEEE